MTEWAAYYRLDPFGGGRGDLQAAIIASVMWNVSVKPSYRLKPKDFMPEFENTVTDTPGMSQQEILNHIKLHFGGGPRG